MCLSVTLFGRLPRRGGAQQQPAAPEDTKKKSLLIIITNYVTKQRAQFNVKCGHTIFIRPFDSTWNPWDTVAPAMNANVPLIVKSIVSFLQN